MVIRGCARQTVVVSGGRGDIFEAAYFIVRPDAPRDGGSERELLGEANRIVRECCLASERPRRRIWPFVLGVLAGAASVGLLWLLCWLL